VEISNDEEHSLTPSTEFLTVMGWSSSESPALTSRPVARLGLKVGRKGRPKNVGNPFLPSLGRDRGGALADSHLNESSDSLLNYETPP
jgi:hypothetical protein